MRSALISGRWLLALAVILLVLPADAGAAAKPKAPGWPQLGMTTFGTVETTADGRIVVVGTSNAQLIVARLLADGSLDTSFGNGAGVALGPFIDTTDQYGSVVAGDGSVTVLSPITNPSTALSMIRFGPDGSLDPSLGGDGDTTIDLPGFHRPFKLHDFALDAQGRALIPGQGVPPGAPTPDDSSFAVARVMPDGHLDQTFGDDGIAQVKPDPDGGAFATSVAVRPSGAILVAGTSVFQTTPTDAAVSIVAAAQLDPNGARDESFGDGGSAVYPQGNPPPGCCIPFNTNYTIATLRAGGGAVLTGSADQLGIGHSSCPQLALVSIDSAGAADEAFGEHGATRSMACQEASATAIAADGSIFTDATRCCVFDDNSDDRIAQVHFSDTGAIETSFTGLYGSRSTGIADNPTSASDLAMTGDGDLLTVGGFDRCDSSCEVGYVMKQAPDGSLDRAFGTDGVVTSRRTRICEHDPALACPYPFRREFKRAVRHSLPKLLRRSLRARLSCDKVIAERCRIKAWISLDRHASPIGRAKAKLDSGVSVRRKIVVKTRARSKLRSTRHLTFTERVKAAHQRPFTTSKRLRLR